MADKLNLYQKISDIIDSLGLIGKDSRAPDAMGGYRFTSHGALIGHLRHELTSRNVVIRASGVELIRADSFETTSYDQKGNLKTKLNYRTIVKYLFTVVDGDNPADFFEDFWIGEGIDGSDKGIQKAGTSAEKYFLMKLFKVGDQDDPDAVDPSGNGVVSSSASFAPTQTASSQSVSQAVTQTQTAPLAIAAGTEISKPMTEDRAGSLFPLEAEVTQDQYKEMINALVWMGEQLPPTSGWFRGKIVPMVSLWDSRKKTGKLTPEDAAAGSAINWVFNQLATAHREICGESCEHLLASKLAILTGGKITDPAVK